MAKQDNERLLVLVVPATDSPRRSSDLPLIETVLSCSVDLTVRVCRSEKEFHDVILAVEEAGQQFDLVVVEAFGLSSIRLELAAMIARQLGNIVQMVMVEKKGRMSRLHWRDQGTGSFTDTGRTCFDEGLVKLLLELTNQPAMVE